MYMFEYLKAEHDFLVVLCEERCRDAVLPGPTGPTDAVAVRLDLARQLVVDHLLVVVWV